jgi:hypothetical protein
MFPKLTYAIIAISGIGLFASMNAEKRMDVCKPTLSGDLSEVEQNADYVLFGLKVTPCLSTGITLLVIVDKTGAYYIDAHAARFDLGEERTEICDVSVSDEQKKVEQNTAIVLDGQIISECRPTGKFLSVQSDGKWLYVTDTSGTRIEIGEAPAQ